MFKRIIALICTFAITFSMLTVSASAAGDYTSEATSYWDQVLMTLQKVGNTVSDLKGLGVGDLVSGVLAGMSENLCGISDDGLHHADYITGSGGTDSHGRYMIAHCKYCAADFKCYGQDFSDAYNDYVKNQSGGENGSFSMSSDGTYKVYPNLLGAIECYNGVSTNSNRYAIDLLKNFVTSGSTSGFTSMSLVPFEREHIFRGDDYVSYYCYFPGYSFVAPFDCSISVVSSGVNKYGTLKLLSSLSGSYSSSNLNVTLDSSVGSLFKGETAYYTVFPIGRNMRTITYSISGYRPVISYPDFSFYLKLTPLTSTTFPGTSTRPTNFIKTVYNISNNTTVNNFFDETNNTYTTSEGDTYNVTNWEYNYGSRFYSFSYQDADSVAHTVVITYADDFVTVTDNGTTSYYYYGLTGGGSGGDSGDSSSSGGSSSGSSSSGGGSGSGIDYTPAINDIIAKLQTLIEQGDANSEYLKKVMDALDSINSNTKDTYDTLLDLLNRVNTGLNYTDDSGKTYSVSELAYYIYAYLKDNLDEKVSGISALLDKILKAIESISPNIDIDIDVDGDGEKDDADTWFNGFLGKFAFVSTLYDCGKQLVSDITNDAASAQAVSAGDIAVQDLTADHAVQAASDGGGSSGGGTISSYTSPEVLLNFPAVSWHGVDFGNMSALDLSWYAPYKSTVDNIVSGFLWLAFLWLLIKRAPGIIQGSAMAESDALKIQDFNYRR